MYDKTYGKNVLDIKFAVHSNLQILPASFQENILSELHSVCTGLHLKCITVVQDVTTAPRYITWCGEDKGPSPPPFIFKCVNAENGLLRKQKVFWAVPYLLILYHLFKMVFTYKFCGGNTIREAMGLLSLVSDCMRHEVPTAWRYLTKHLMPKI